MIAHLATIITANIINQRRYLGVELYRVLQTTRIFQTTTLRRGYIATQLLCRDLDQVPSLTVAQRLRCSVGWSWMHFFERRAISNKVVGLCILYYQAGLIIFPVLSFRRLNSSIQASIVQITISVILCFLLIT